jgi:hypothetical protein
MQQQRVGRGGRDSAGISNGNDGLAISLLNRDDHHQRIHASQDSCLCDDNNKQDSMNPKWERCELWRGSAGEG